MGRVDSSNETENAQPVGGVPNPSYQGAYAPTLTGTPWSTGLFDCHLDQTNGMYTFLSYTIVILVSVMSDHEA